ncbi:MAG: condensation domain-containing protein, partial [Phocaeicola sp.]
QSSVVEVKEIGNVQHLCAYYTSLEAIDEELLRKELSESLTDYMVPSVFMRLDRFPLTPNGKVNRKALPLPEMNNQTEYMAPQGEVEEILADYIKSILNLSSPVGRLDSFFSLGGDSIKSIRLVSLLRQKGITIQVSDIMKLKTVKAIAAFSLQGAGELMINQNHWSGEVAYTAIEILFFDSHLLCPSHFNQSTLLQSVERVDVDTLGSTFELLSTHHDMLRALYRDGVQYVRKAKDDGLLYNLRVCDLRDSMDYKIEMEREAEILQQSMDLEHGPLFQSVLFRLPDFDALLIVIHHLVVDGISWRILIEDINTLYGQIRRGEQVSLPKKTHSFQEWSAAIGRYRQSYQLLQEVSYWKGVQAEMREYPCEERSSSMNKVQRLLSPEITKRLLGESSKAYHTEINDLLLTALGRSYAVVTGSHSLCIQLEGHGREPIHESILIDRTVGWFTSAYPVVIRTNDDLRQSIRSVKETLRRIPNRGLGYGILQYIGSDENSLDRDITPQLCFNYLGSFSESNEDSFFTINNRLPQGSSIAPENVFGPAFSINCLVADEQLTIMYSYDCSIWSDEEAILFADSYISELESIVAHTGSCIEPEYTASDLGETSWSDEEFISLYNHYKERGEEIERIYPLTSMQQGMLLATMMDKETSSYHILSRFSLDILPTPQQLESVLELLSAKHEVLRTSILSNGIEEPRQVLLKGRKLGIKFIDLSSSESLDSDIASIEDREFHMPIDLQDDSLFRLVCIQTTPNACQLLFVMHHIIVDGWCISLYLNDFKLYLDEVIKGKIGIHETHCGEYEHYVRDILSKDSRKALSYWRELLSGYDTKAIIPSYGAIEIENQSKVNSVWLELARDVSTTLQELCASEGVTLNTVVELAWGLLLQCYNRTRDSLFVKVVSGRDNTHDSVEHLVGLFINSVPVRVKSEENDTLLDLLHKLQQQAADTNEFDYCSLSEIQQQSELGGELFQSILAFENYAIEEDKSPLESFTLKLLSAKEANISDIGVVAYLGELLTVGIKFNTSLYSFDEINRLSSCLKEV